jgi:chaperonin cofactor prefoldin
MIKFSHAELDRRVRTLETDHRSLEETVANLQARLERLESSTH